jgi:16S rRNA (guanine527-N7)-methyltransferase
VFDEYPALRAHFELLQRWNKSLNLTRIDSVERNYGESLFLGRHLPPGPLRICDIGSGAGFPGFPVAVLRPDCEITLIEAHQRKAVFLKEA